MNTRHGVTAVACKQKVEGARYKNVGAEKERICRLIFDRVCNGPEN